MMLHLLHYFVLSEEKVFAIYGCNATLEWTLWNKSFDLIFLKVIVFNSSGTSIAWFNGLHCTNTNDSPISCKTTNRRGEWMLSVILINVTSVNEGRYTARIKYALEYDERNITKHLMLIDKPKIKKPLKFIIGMPLNLTCTIDGILDNGKYRWKLNETDLNSMGHIYARASTLMFESLRTVDKSSFLSCEVCQENSCCVQSETFVLDPYYAAAAPSSPENNDGFLLRKYWMGPLIVLIFLIIVIALILVTHWSNNTSRGPESCHLRVEHADYIASSKELERHNMPLPSATLQEYELKTKRLEYKDIKRTSVSFQNHSNQTISVRNHATEIVPLQNFTQTPNAMQRQTGKCVNNRRSSEQDILPLSKVRYTKENRKEELFARRNEDHNDSVSRHDHNTGAQSQELNNSRKNNFGTKLQQDLYSNIDEDSLPVYQQRTDNTTDETSQESEKRTEHVFYDYAYSFGICHVDTADVHITDGTYITPVSDLAHSFEICKDEETCVLETDHTYLTLIDDIPNSTEITPC